MAFAGGELTSSNGKAVVLDIVETHALPGAICRLSKFGTHPVNETILVGRASLDLGGSPPTLEFYPNIPHGQNRHLGSRGKTGFVKLGIDVVGLPVLFSFPLHSFGKHQAGDRVNLVMLSEDIEHGHPQDSIFFRKFSSLGNSFCRYCSARVAGALFTIFES